MAHKRREDRNAYARNWRTKNPSSDEQRRRNQDRKKRLRLKKKQDLIKSFGGQCKICGYKKCIHALEFHHKNPKEKDVGISRNITFEKMLIEAKKCILVCANCHREIHAKDWS